MMLQLGEKKTKIKFQGERNCQRAGKGKSAGCTEGARDNAIKNMVAWRNY